MCVVDATILSFVFHCHVPQQQPVIKQSMYENILN